MSHDYIPNRALREDSRCIECGEPINPTHVEIQWQDGVIGDVGINGTQVENVLAVCVARLEYLRTLKSDRYTSLAITKVEEAIHWLNARTANREARGVEGTNED
jgi:hypothetical protein